MFERYTEATRRAIFFARAEAIQRGAETIEASDLFLGLILEAFEDGSPLLTLHQMAAGFRTLFGRLPEIGMPTVQRDVALSKHAKIALARGAEETDSNGSRSIDRRFLLLGILRGRDETSRRLRAAGVDLEYVRTGCGHSEPAGIRRFFRRNRCWWRDFRGIAGILLLVASIAAAVLYLRSQN